MFNVGQYRKIGNSLDCITPITDFNINKSGNKIIVAFNSLPANYYYFKITVNHNRTIDNTLMMKLQNSIDATNDIQTIGQMNLVSRSQGTFPWETTCKSLTAFSYLIIDTATEINLSDINVEVYRITNIFNLPEIARVNTKIKHFGIQSKPYQLLCVNGNPVRVGKSGLLEINNPNIIFNFVGVIAKDQDNFIIDYQYATE